MLSQDLQQTLRQLRKRPGYALTAMATLAPGAKGSFDRAG
jgi:hypothetical protein